MTEAFDDLISKATITLKEIYSKMDETNKLEDKKNKEDVINKFGPIFSFDNIDSLQYDKVEEFSREANNHHWTGLNRKINDVNKNFDEIKKALKILVDPKLEPVETRLTRADKLSKGMGPAFLTAILYVEYPEEYAVLNRTTYNALNDLGLVDYGDNNLIKNYSSTNDIILKLKKLTGLDLWELDRVFYEYVREKSKNHNIDQNKPRWFVEKTNQATHNIKSVQNSGIGEMLRSPKADAKGRNIYHQMTKINPGDYIIHLVMDKDNSITGVSVAKEKASSFVTPKGNLWEGDNFVVKLEGFTKLSPSLKWSEIKENEKNRLIQLLAKYNNGLFYNKNLGLRGGNVYLSAAPEELVSIINDVYVSKTGENIPYFTPSASTQPKSDAVSNQSEEIQKNMPKNIILHGPVGTGKTFYAKLLALGLTNHKISGIKGIEALLSGKPEKVNFFSNLKSGEQIKTVTFHQSYGYEDFIGGIKAITGGNGNIEYKVVPGVFKTLCDTARKDINKPYVIIIDEINRGDISRIFGELITLIEDDKRSNKDSEGITIKLPNFDEEFSVPENVYIIGTMNDSDKSIALLDVALRRRFLFFLIPPYSKIIEGWINEKIKDEKFKNTVIDLFNMLNKNITETKGEDFRIGHAFFKELKDTDDPYETLRQIFLYKIIPLLKEIYYGRDEILYDTVLKGKFFKRIEGSENVYYQRNGDSLDSTESFRLELNNLLDKKR